MNWSRGAHGVFMNRIISRTLWLLQVAIRASVLMWTSIAHGQTTCTFHLNDAPATGIINVESCSHQGKVIPVDPQSRRNSVANRTSFEIKLLSTVDSNTVTCQLSGSRGLKVQESDRGHECG